MEKKVKLGELARIREKIISQRINTYKPFTNMILEWNEQHQQWHYNCNDVHGLNTNGWKTVFKGHIRKADLFSYYIDEKRDYLGQRNKMTYLEIISEYRIFERWLKLCEKNGFEFTNKFDNWKLNL